jgi:GTP-binding protein
MTEDPDRELPLVAVVGRPNVGKSTLYNRLIGRRSAIAGDEPGVTRDRRYGTVEWAGRAFRLVDTGGLDPAAKDGILVGIRKQAQRAIQEAVLVLLVIDAIEGPNPLDVEVAHDLRRLGKTVLVLANKVDSSSAEAAMAQAYELGFPDVFGVSASHGRGIGDMLDEVLARLPAAPAAPAPEAEREAEAEAGKKPDDGAIRFAFIGKPNAGKSSLCNRLLGEERVLVHEKPGTTMDPIDTPLSFYGQEFVLIDTAGIRKKRTSYTQTERVAVEMAMRQVERADVVGLVVDGVEGPSEQDARIAGEIEQKGRAAIIIVNKADLLTPAQEDALRKKLREDLRHIDWAPILFVSALSGRNVERILERTQEVYREYSRRVATAEVNRWFEGVLAEHPPPFYKGKPVRLYYITQVEVRPPTFVAQANFPEAVAYTYRRYLINQLRATFDFRGSPIRLMCRRRSRK